MSQQNPTPEERQRIVSSMMSKFGLDKTTPEAAMMAKFNAMDTRVKALIRDEYAAHGFIRNKQNLQQSIGQAFFEELKAFDEGEMRSFTASLLALRATEEL